jgi:hypothetical protein
MLSITKNNIVLNVVMLIVIMLSVVMLNVVAPYRCFHKCCKILRITNLSFF